MNDEFLAAIEEIKQERDLDQDLIIGAFKDALDKAFRHDFGIPDESEIKIEIDLSGRELDAFVEKKVVDEITNFAVEIDQKTAEELNGEVSTGDMVWYPLNPASLSRTATHRVKQMMIDRIQSGVQHQLYEQFSDKESELVNAVVRRIDEKTVFLSLDDDVEAILPYREQIESDDYTVGNRMKVLIVKVRLQDDGLLVVTSRTHPQLIERLFELHIPEVHDGLVEVVNVAREAGTRSKVAVRCHDPTLDPIGTCVGPQSSRIQSIVEEINGEKIDIIPHEEDVKEFIRNALSPAEVTRVNLVDDEKIAQVVVPEDQLSLAIGKGGQNARLTAKLCDWSIDIYSEQEFAELQSGAAREVAASIFKDTTESDEVDIDLTAINGVGPGLAEKMRDAGFGSPAEILEAGADALMDVSGVGETKAESILEQVTDLVQATLSDEDEDEIPVGEDETAEEVKESLFGEGSDDTDESDTENDETDEEGQPESGFEESDDSQSAESDSTDSSDDEASATVDADDTEDDEEVQQIAPGETPFSSN